VDTGEAIMMPDNETINRHIYRMLGHCLAGDDCECIPHEYTSDDSPRRLLNEAVDKAVEMVGEKAFQSSLWLTLKMGVNFYERNEALLIGARATNQQIATAIYNATKVDGK
jgi:hypothetical protein